MDWKVVPFQESENLRMFYYSKRLKASNKIEMWLQLRKLLCQETISKIEYIIQPEMQMKEWKTRNMETIFNGVIFFVYAFFDKIIQFLSKPEIRHLFSKKIGKIYTNCARTFYKYWLMKLRFWLIYFLKEHKNSATTFISITWRQS